jgi:2',3'-cyclic-nucleotide 2'-phosphodiesterase (5'-nucleotidase family)
LTPPAVGARAPARGPLLRVVSVNDVYALDNLPRLASLLRVEAGPEGEGGPPDAFLAVLAGDFVAPSMLSSLDRGRGMVDCLNAAGITHLILGNHEDDIPPAELHRRIREFRGTWISTNARSFDRRLVPHQVVEVASAGRTVRVGLVGVVMTDPSIYRRAPFGGTPLTDPNATALREATRLRAELRCDVVIPITHQSLADDRALARSPVGFPVILGGHEHEVHVEEVGATWLVKAGTDAIDAAVVDLAWTEDASARDVHPAVTVRMVKVGTYPEEAAVRACVDAHMRQVHALEDAIILPLRDGEALSSVGARSRQTSLGTLICTRLRDALGADACVLNGGGVRANRDYASHLAYGDIRAELPFDNEMVVANLPGRVLADAVASSRAIAPRESGGFLQVDDGVTVLGPGARITQVAGAPFDPDRVYRVALVRAFLTGMDHIEPLVAFASAHPEEVPHAGSGRELKEVLVESLALSMWHSLGGFDALDADHDGVVGEAEVSAAIARVTRQVASPMTLTLVMNAVDKNHDRHVSRDESNAADLADAAG